VEDAIGALTAARVPCAPVRSMEEAMAHPHMAERQAFSSVAHPGRGEVRVTSAPFHIDGEPVPARGPAPYRAGEDTRAILSRTLGYSAERIDELLRAGAVAEP
jgi:crotonobetainyl-CoA:carnitine CoA-transferase CaiB-like acyl-CoA transferase